MFSFSSVVSNTRPCNLPLIKVTVFPTPKEGEDVKVHALINACFEIYIAGQLDGTWVYNAQDMEQCSMRVQSAWGETFNTSQAALDAAFSKVFDLAKNNAKGLLNSL